MWKYSQTYEYAVVDPSGQTKKESAWCKFFFSKKEVVSQTSQSGGTTIVNTKPKKRPCHLTLCAFFFSLTADEIN